MAGFFLLLFLIIAYFYGQQTNYNGFSKYA